MPTFGPVFARRAFAPLARAKEELGAGRVREALSALDPPKLAEALRLGLADVAAAAAAPLSDVEALLPWDTIDRALAAVGESRAAAAAVWAELPPIPGGLLAGVAEVTTHAENDDLGFYLDRLAEKMARDRSLAGPIDQLSTDVEAFQSLLATATQTLDDHPRLLGARARRRRIRIGIAAALVAIAVPTAAAVGVSWRRREAARERVAAALSAPDPCLAESISAEDLKTAGREAEARTRDRLAACAEVRARARRVAACNELVEAIEAGRPPEGAGAEAAGAELAMLERVAKGALVPEDLARAPRFPCEETGAPPRLWAALLDAAGAQVALWSDPPALADEIVEKLAARGLPPVARGTLLSRAEEISGHGVRQGDARSLVRGAELCDLARRLSIETGPNCRGLDVVRAKDGRKP